MKAWIVDTHAFVWWVRGRPLGRMARRALHEVDAGRSHAWIPAIVAVEIAFLHERGRSAIGVPQLEATLARNPDVGLLPLDLAQATEFALLGAVRDPFDRLIVAAARSAGCPLLTADAAIAASGLVEVVWD